MYVYVSVGKGDFGRLVATSAVGVWVGSTLRPTLDVGIFFNGRVCNGPGLGRVEVKGVIVKGALFCSSPKIFLEVRGCQNGKESSLTMKVFATHPRPPLSCLSPIRYE